MFAGILGHYGHFIGCEDGSLPDFLHDLALDTIIGPMLRSDTSGYLHRIFLSPLDDGDAIRERQDVFRDLADQSLLHSLDGFSRDIEEICRCLDGIRRILAGDDSLSCRRRAMGHMLHISELYVKAVSDLSDAFDRSSLSSAILENFSSFIHDYISSDRFRSLSSDADTLRKRFSSLRYSIHIRKGTVQVFPLEHEDDLLERVKDVFRRFSDKASESYLKNLSDEPSSEQVEDSVMGLLERTYPEEFGMLESFCSRYQDLADETIARSAHEIRFYVSWIAIISRLSCCGLHFCLPRITEDDFYADDFFDMALADDKGHETVPSSFRLSEGERIIVVTGPNQGGKTTFARAFGQLHYLASLGLPVPGTDASLMISDRIFTHFGREEEAMSGSGRLEDDVVRLKEILDACTSRSIIVINEIFASTTVSDAIGLGNRMLDLIADRGSIAIVVTFLDELALHGPETVSMVSITSPESPGVRTFHLERRPPDGLAFAMGMARRYGLDGKSLSRRLDR